MSALFRLIRNVVVALSAAFQSFFRLLVRAKPVEWVAYELHGRVRRGSREDRRSFVARLPRGTRIYSVAQLRQELEHLRGAPGLRGIVVHLKSVHCGAAILRELREVFASFRASGREVVFFAEALDTRDYWLASAGSGVWLPPRGRLDLLGFAAASSAAARPLKRLGIVFDVIRAGLYKSAGELLGAERVSDAQKHQLDELLGDLYELTVGDLAKGRGITPQAVRAAVDDGPYTARRAHEAKLVDALVYADEVRARLAWTPSQGPFESLPVAERRRARIGPFAAVFATHGAPADWLSIFDRRPLVAVLDVDGVITQGKARALPGLAATAGSDDLVAALTRLRRDRKVRAVVVKIDSRGGSALASDLIWHATVRLAAEKPVVAYLDDVAASGGYYIAAAARKIHASPTCITGSIGVFALRPDVTQALEKAEIDRATIVRGAQAALYRPDHRLTDAERAALQRDVLETYGDFVSVVAQGRGLPEARVRELAEGRVYLATRAATLGLVDTLGTIDGAIDEAATFANLEGPVRVVGVKLRQGGWREVWQAWRRSGPEGVARLYFPGKADAVQALYTGEAPGT